MWKVLFASCFSKRYAMLDLSAKCHSLREKLTIISNNSKKSSPSIHDQGRQNVRLHWLSSSIYCEKKFHLPPHASRLSGGRNYFAAIRFSKIFPNPIHQIDNARTQKSASRSTINKAFISFPNNSTRINNKNGMSRQIKTLYENSRKQLTTRGGWGRVGVESPLLIDSSIFSRIIEARSRGYFCSITEITVKVRKGFIIARNMTDTVAVPTSEHCTWSFFVSGGRLQSQRSRQRVFRSGSESRDSYFSYFLAN